MMDVTEFEDLLGRFGDDLTSWPAPRRDDANLLLRGSDQARAALAESRRLRQVFRAEPIRAPDGLLDRIMQKARQATSEPSNNEHAGPDGTSAVPPKGSALILALCLCGGLVGTPPPDDAAMMRHAMHSLPVTAR